MNSIFWSVTCFFFSAAACLINACAFSCAEGVCVTLSGICSPEGSLVGTVRADCRRDADRGVSPCARTDQKVQPPGRSWSLRSALLSHTFHRERRGDGGGAPTTSHGDTWLMAAEYTPKLRLTVCVKVRIMCIPQATGLSQCQIVKSCLCLNVCINGCCPGPLAWTECYSLQKYSREHFEIKSKKNRTDPRKWPSRSLGVPFPLPAKLTGNKYCIT